MSPQDEAFCTQRDLSLSQPRARIILYDFCLSVSSRALNRGVRVEPREKVERNAVGESGLGRPYKTIFWCMGARRVLLLRFNTRRVNKKRSLRERGLPSGQAQDVVAAFMARGNMCLLS